MRKLRDMLEDKNNRLAEAIKLSEKAKVLVESKEREIRMIRENNERSQLMSDLLAPLNREKAEVMRNLLESVQTTRLKNAFEKYLPAVMEDRAASSRKVIAEQVVAVTGDKTVPNQQETDGSNVIELKRLAGL